MLATTHRIRDVLSDVALYLAGGLATLIPGSGSLILCLHSVVSAQSVPRGQIMAVTRLFLEAVVAQLRRSDVAILTLAEGITRLERGDRRPFVCFTFDDGYRDFYDVVFPMAVHLEVPVTCFITTGFVEGSAPMWWNALERAIADVDVLAWRGGRRIVATAAAKRTLYAEVDHAFRLLRVEGQRALLEQLAGSNPSFELHLAYDAALTWPMIKTMAASGLVEIGSHTIDHPVLATLDDGEMTAQLEGARTILRDRTGLAIRYLAYPYGQACETGATAAEATRRAGYDAAFTTVAAAIAPAHLKERYSLPRLMLGAGARSAAVVEAYRSGVLFRLRRGHAVLPR